MQVPRDTLTVLSISPFEGDHMALQSILAGSPVTLFKAARVDAVRDVLRKREVSVVVCERDLAPGSWTDVLECIIDLPSRPSLIVTSRLADDRLWCEALNLGAWDVVAKPFDRNELQHSVKSAWQHWQNQLRLPVLSMKAAS